MAGLEGKGKERLEARLGAIATMEGAELASLCAAAVEGAELVWAGAWGRRYIDPEDSARDLPATPDTLFRVASVSKPVTAIGAMLLVERGLLDLEADLSEYLGFPLRNPHWPETPITAAMLLSHTSSIRDEGGYAIPLPCAMRDFILSGIEGVGKLAWAPPIAGRDASPGRYFCYSNLNYGILATLMERLSGERFDLYMRDRVLRPLEIDGGYNLGLFSPEELGRLAAIYRKADAEEHWRPGEPWRAQVDDCRGLAPLLSFRAQPGLGPEALDAYEPGRNGAIFSPQGGLRVSILGLSKILRLFLRRGEAGGCRLLSPESVDRMTTERWTYDPEARNGDLYSGLTRATGLGLCRTAAARDELGGDQLVEGGGPRLWGHHGDAYGLLAGLLFDPAEAYGFAYLIGGTAVSPASRRGRYSSWFGWEEAIHEAFLEEGGRGAPYRTGLWRWRGERGELDPFSLSGFSADAGGLVFLPEEAIRVEGEGGLRLVSAATSPVLPAPFPASEFIPSWNAELPLGGRLECSLRALQRHSWTPWYSLGRWAEGEARELRSSVEGQADEGARVLTDTLVLAAPADFIQLRVELSLPAALADELCAIGNGPSAAASPKASLGAAPPASLPVLRELALAFSQPKAGASTARRSGGDPSLWGRRVEGVPAYSQMVYPDGGNTWCSPTSLSMIMAYWEKDASPPEPRVRRTVAGVYDVAWKGCGNWAFNVAYAGARGYEALVARFPSLAALEPYIAAGLPLALSVSWDESEGRPLTAAPVPRSSGHLTLLVGFDASGQPLMHEPAAREPDAVPRSYRREELEARWLEASGGTVYLVLPRGKALPGFS